MLGRAALRQAAASAAVRRWALPPVASLRIASAAASTQPRPAAAAPVAVSAVLHDVHTQLQRISKGYDPLKAAASGLRANLRAALVDFGGLPAAEADRRLETLESASDADLQSMALKPMERQYATLVLRLKRLRQHLRAVDAIMAGAAVDEAVPDAAAPVASAASAPDRLPASKRPTMASKPEQTPAAAAPAAKRQPAQQKALPTSPPTPKAPASAPVVQNAAQASPFAAFDGLATTAARGSNGASAAEAPAPAVAVPAAVVTDARALAPSAAANTAAVAATVPTSLQGQLVGTLRGHSRRVTAVLPLPGQRLVSASTDNSVRVWDLQAMTCLRTLGPHASGPTALALLPGNVLAASGFDPAVSLWSLDDGKRIATLSGHQYHVHTLAAFADGFLLSACSETIRVWDIANKRTVMLVPAQTTAMALLPDGSVLAGGADGAISQWNLGTASVSRSFRSHDGVNAKVTAFALLQNGKVVSGARQSELLLHDLTTGTSMQLDTFGAGKGAAFQSAAGIASLAVLADGSLAVARHKRHLCVRDPASGELIRAEGFLKHDTRCESTVAANADGLLFTAGFEVPPSASALKQLPESGRGIINVWR